MILVEALLEVEERGHVVVGDDAAGRVAAACKQLGDRVGGVGQAGRLRHHAVARRVATRHQAWRSWVASTTRWRRHARSAPPLCRRHRGSASCPRGSRSPAGDRRAGYRPRCRARCPRPALAATGSVRLSRNAAARSPPTNEAARAIPIASTAKPSEPIGRSTSRVGLRVASARSAKNSSGVQGDSACQRAQQHHCALDALEHQLLLIDVALHPEESNHEAEHGGKQPREVSKRGLFRQGAALHEPAAIGEGGASDRPDSAADQAVRERAEEPHIALCLAMGSDHDGPGFAEPNQQARHQARAQADREAASDARPGGLWHTLDLRAHGLFATCVFDQDRRRVVVLARRATPGRPATRWPSPRRSPRWGSAPTCSGGTPTMVYSPTAARFAQADAVERDRHVGGHVLQHRDEEQLGRTAAGRRAPWPHTRR